LALGCCISHGAHGQCSPIIFDDSIAMTDPIQALRLNRDGTTSTCTVPKSCPGPVNFPNTHYDVTFYVNTSNAAQCVVTTITTNCLANPIFMVAYLGSFNPSNPCTNYLADIGSSPAPSQFMSFTVPAGGSFALVVHEVLGGVGCGQYTVQVLGTGICKTALPTVPGACCFPATGACAMATVPGGADCTAAGGIYQGNNTSCATVACPPPPPPTPGACCFPNTGACMMSAIVGGSDCTAAGGVYQGNNTSCATVTCPPPPPPAPGACCFPATGQCAMATMLGGADCTAAGGIYQGNNTSCATVNCPPPPPAPGACCFPATGMCTMATMLGGADCTAAGGVYQGNNTLCANVVCPPPDRVDATQKGAVLIFSKVELRWDASGLLVTDTFIQLTNDNNAGTYVQLYFINGDPPTPAIPAGYPGGPERAHPGWNRIDNTIYLTANQPSYWSALTGQPGAFTGPVSPFTILDPGFPPGRPDPDSAGMGGGAPTDRVLRGFIIAFAVNANGAEIKWNHLAGNTTLVDYRQATAWQYNAWSFQAIDPMIQTGDPTGTPGVINLNGVEFAQAFDQLLMNFQAVGSAGFSGPAHQVVSDTDLTLHLINTDVRQNGTGPRTTKVVFDVWNQNELKFSGAERCITCWLQRLLGLWSPISNHFIRPNLQTNVGKARINGVASPVVCNDPAYPSTAEPLLGVIATKLVFNGMQYAVAGTNVHGLGFESATIQFDLSSPPLPANQWPQLIDNAWLFVDMPGSRAKP
jgi:hypothetical protein